MIEELAGSPVGIGAAATVLLLLLVLLLRRRGAGGGDLRAAHAAQKRGQLTTAARLFADAGEIDRALDLYVEAGSWLPAAELALKAGRKDRAASLYERGGRYGEAAALLEEVRQLEPAARLWQRAGKVEQAASLYERVGDFDSAARAWVQAQNWARAGELHLKRRRFDQALPLYEKAYAEAEGALDSGPPKAREATVELGRRLAELLERASRIEEAIRVRRRIGDLDRAAELLVQAGRPDDAAGLLRESGRTQDAARLLEEAGRGDQALKVRAEALAEEAEFADAARLAMQYGDTKQALDWFVQAGMPGEAAKLAHKLEQWPRAADLYRQARETGRAAACYARAGQWDEAARQYQMAGDRERMVEALIKGGKYYEAAQHRLQAGDTAGALSLLERIGAGQPGARRAMVQRADILARDEARRGEALELYRKALSDQKVAATSLEPFYRYAALAQQADAAAEALEVFEAILRYDPRFRDVAERARALRPPETMASTTEQDPAIEPAAPTETSSAPRSSSARRRRYVILEELGRGGMGIVYKAMDRMLDRVVAFKVLPTDMRQNEAVVKNFFREAKAAAAMTHPNIVVVYDAGEEDDVCYIAMEFVEGPTLKQMVRKDGPFPVPLLILVGGQTARGLAYAHSRKIVHRDVKPSNLMWQTREKQVKIADFGLAKVIQEVVNFQTVVGGTPHYMSPEQILGEEIDQRSDIYSLGATLYELATGRVPFPKGDTGYHHIHTEPDDPLSLRPELPRAIADVILRCMHKDPADRYPDGEAVFEALQAAREAGRAG